MIINKIAYSNTDEECQEICDFLNELSIKNPFMLWESGRMNFWRYNVHAKRDWRDRFFRDNAQVWRADNQKIVGLCISEYGANDIFFEVLPAYHCIYPDIFHWIETTWATTRKAIEIDVFSDDILKINLLEEQGFAFLCHAENKWIYDLEQIYLGYCLEEGFIIQTFSESLNYAGRITLVQSAFKNPNYSEINLKGLTTSPDHIDEYDLMVISPDRQPVAYCVGWHEHSKEHHGYIEPVGTHAAYRQRGFAKAVIRECFGRMKANGIKTVEIASGAEPAAAYFLYASLSPQTIREVHKYRKKKS